MGQRRIIVGSADSDGSGTTDCSDLIIDKKSSDISSDEMFRSSFPFTLKQCPTSVSGNWWLYVRLFSASRAPRRESGWLGVLATTFADPFSDSFSSTISDRPPSLLATTGNLRKTASIATGPSTSLQTEGTTKAHVCMGSQTVSSPLSQSTISTCQSRPSWWQRFRDSLCCKPRLTSPSLRS